MNDDIDILAITRQGFINRVINHFINEVVKPFYADITNIHRGPFRTASSPSSTWILSAPYPLAEASNISLVSVVIRSSEINLFYIV